MQAHSHRPSSAINSTDQVAGAVLTSSRPASTNVTSSSSADQSESSQTDQDLLTADIETASISSSAEMSPVPDSSNSTAMWSQGAQAAAAQPLPASKDPITALPWDEEGAAEDGPAPKPQELGSMPTCCVPLGLAAARHLVFYMIMTRGCHGMRTVQAGEQLHLSMQQASCLRANVFQNFR